MNDPALIVTATHGVPWTSWTSAPACELVAAEDPAAAATSAAGRDAWLIGWIEHPAVGLARMLVSDGPVDADGWLAQWRRSADILLQHARSRPSTTLLLAAREVADDPDAFHALVDRRCPDPVARLTRSIRPSPIPEPDDLARLLADGIVGRSPAPGRLHAELLSRSWPLGPVDPARPLRQPGVNTVAADAAEALRRLFAEREVARQASRQSQQRQQAIDRGLDGVREQLARTQGELTAVQGGLDRLRKVERDGQQARQDARSARDEAERAASAAAALGLEADLLRRQIVQLQGELRAAIDETVQSRLPTRSPSDPHDIVRVTAASVTRVSERLRSMHRELSLRWCGLRIGERDPVDVDVRLVEHQGHPGLVLFAADGGVPLLTEWRPNGDEAGRPYMRMVPDDASCRSLFDAMDSGDIATLNAIVLMIARCVAPGTRGRLDVDPVWGSVARRLRHALHTMHGHLRFAAATVGEAATDGEVDVRLSDVNWNGCRWSSIQVRWRPFGEAASITLVADETGGVPLIAWPCDGEGQPVPNLVLPLSTALPAPGRRRPWLSLCETDRRFVGALASAWPRLLAASGCAAARPDWVRAAATMAADAERAARRDPPFWQRVTGRAPQRKPREKLGVCAAAT